MNTLKTSKLYSRLLQTCQDPQQDLRLLDLHIGLFLAQLDPDQSPALLLAASLTSAALANGHVCLPLQALCEHGLSEYASGEHVSSEPAYGEKKDLSDSKQWAARLRQTGLVGSPGDLRPLILDQHQRLYLFRYHQYETDIAAKLLVRARLQFKPDLEQAQQWLSQLADNGNLDDGQKTAAALALLRGLVLISGGPGTGKTHTLAYTLALIQAMQAHAGKAPLRIALAAPTGKAAARMKESIRVARSKMSDDFSPAVPDDAQTLHRLLGLRPGAEDFRYNEGNPLHIDMLVLDEASMIDMVMMDGLLRALPPHCRLILMGDHHQLPSVEAGQLFADLCRHSAAETGYSAALAEDLNSLLGISPNMSGAPTLIKDSIVQLHTNHRQADSAGLSELAEAVDMGSITEIQRVFDAQYPTLNALPLNGARRMEWLTRRIVTEYQDFRQTDSLDAAFEKMEGFRILCTVREGPMGVEGINELTESLLKQPPQARGTADLYPGKPIIIRQNHYPMQLFNGDTGLLWEDPDDEGQLKAWFKDADGTLISHRIARLPAYDSAYAITVHQAQGSEFKRVVLLLPEDESRILSRELIYTGVTRARDSLSLCYDEQTLAFAITQESERYSGLHELLVEDFGRVP